MPVSAGNPERGTDLFAVGHPLGEGLSFSVSRGIVSGFREMDGVRFIQTDASLNPGNSGGPLLDMNGHLVAIVVWKAVGADLEGLGFGVPIQDALSAVGSRIR